MTDTTTPADNIAEIETPMAAALTRADSVPKYSPRVAQKQATAPVQNQVPMNMTPAQSAPVNYAASQPVVAQITPPPTPSTLQPAPADAAEMTFVQAAHAVNAHYMRGAKNIKFVAPIQFIDGASCDFIDGDADTWLASARLRLKNTLHVDKSTGNMTIAAYISDLAYVRNSINIEFNIN